MAAQSVPAEAPRDCPLCPRLVAFREANREKFPSYFNGAVESFGDEKARLLVVGLAPGLHGANQTGRPFTGDYAGDLLYFALKEKGFATGTYDKRPDDGFTLKDVLISNSVRCVPPENKPTPAEINTCRPFLISRMQAMPQVKVMLALGKIAHDSAVKAMGLKLSAYPFGHAAVHTLPDGRTLVDSYHCSRYNVNTGRLTTEMFLNVLDICRERL
ncbi:uracil-DNA glycosylase [Gimibacter soli]|uniref:Type-5 uracil-DNA glycosylase n=1 Tax=Gimibacter soli TaxID=3024400 RepID=A0AAE9XUP7_9PROT|nr:uracil-DNA glycosylase [Gimibacter soli]WCL55735.1 uracil-DNA glycosylase [Gimibacter soli]